MLIESDLALERAVAALIEQDQVRLAPVFSLTGLPPLRRRAPGFEGLVWIIVSQQVSVASANAIMARVCAAFETVAPQIILSAGEEKLRSCGLSAPKIRTLLVRGQRIYFYYFVWAIRMHGQQVIWRCRRQSDWCLALKIVPVPARWRSWPKAGGPIALWRHACSGLFTR